MIESCKSPCQAEAQKPEHDFGWFYTSDFMRLCNSTSFNSKKTYFCKTDDALASPYPFMPSHSSLSSFFINDFEIFTLCLYLPVFMSGRNNDLVTKVKCENLESWNLFSSIAGLDVCEGTLHLSDHQFLYLAKKTIPILHYICMV